MTRKFAFLLLALALPLSGCEKIKSLPFLKKKKPVEVVQQPVPVAPPPAPAPKPAPKPPEEPPKPDPSKSAVVVLCYHRFEDRPKDSLALKPVDFELQLQSIKDNGFAVVSMSDFLAWRRGEKQIPEKSCLITIDDGYRTGYEVAWPILKKFGYPFTMFIYTNYIKGQPNAGGQSLTWRELEEMRDAGVDIQSHTVSHLDLRAKKGRAPEVYEQWVRDELVNSKRLLEQQLGISVKALAYPFGNHNAEVRRIAMEAGYEVAFSVYGQRLTYHNAPEQLGRYAIESSKPQIFESAMKMAGGGAGADAGSVVSQLAASSMITQPMEGETVTDPRPVIKANLSTLGVIDPGSLEVRLSGVGPIPVKYDPETKIFTGQPPQKLRDPSYTVLVSAKVKGRKTEVRWSFNYGAPGAAVAAPAAQTEAPPVPKKQKEKRRP
jgi:peptidoglycan/xylan/chitin deacetylase (PgdA/CDA1 family)